MAIWTEETRTLPNGKQQASFGMDSLSDIANLPQLSDRVSAGSDAFAVLEKKVVFLGSDGIWK